MKAAIIRTGSIPVHNHFVPTGSSRLSLSSRSLSCVSLHVEPSPATGLRRALSETDVIRLGNGVAAVEGVGVPGGGIGRNSGGGDRWSAGGYGGGSHRRKMGEYYREMLRLNPGDALLLANYAKFLHEVEGDTIKAGEYYGRAILANPSDGEVLSLYGKLIWETERDGERAKTYFLRALNASPDNLAVLGMYANFMWEAEEDEDDSKDRENKVFAALIQAF